MYLFTGLRIPIMKMIEVRRHSIRSKPGDHLNQSGVTLARLVGENLGPFDRVVTSTLPRAYETAIAMGFAVGEQNELMSTYGRDVEREAPWPLSLAGYAEVVQNGRAALVINHGGVLELDVVACLFNEDYASWGDAADYCEGARIFWEDGKCVNAELLRVPK